MIKKRSSVNKICMWCALILLIFIWGNSCIGATNSGAASGTITKAILKIINSFFGINVSFNTLHILIRKLAHFTEYAVYGLLLKGAAQTNAITTMFIGLLTAVADECIQYFTPGRAASVRDIIVDFTGFVCGMIVFWILRAMWHEFQNTVLKKHREKKNRTQN